MSEIETGPGVEPAAAPDQKTVIVYVEADADNLLLVKKVLESTGEYEVHGAGDMVSGLQLIDRHRPNLVLTDLDLPVANGFELLRRIRTDRRLNNETPVAVVTAGVMKGERRRSMAAGFSAFIEKPFDIEEFRAAVKRSLKSARAAPADGPEFVGGPQD